MNDLSAVAAKDEPAAVTQGQAQSEVQEYLQISQQRRRLFPRAALVGLLAGLVATAFRGLLAAGDGLRNALVAWSHHYAPLGGALPICFGAVGAWAGAFP